jgi:hypothetical protein
MNIGVLIEVDKSNSLGNSCIRDLINLSHELVKKRGIDTIYVLTNNNVSTRIKKLFNGKCIFSKIYNLQKQLTVLVDRIGITGHIFIGISGHGYSMTDTSGDEDDGRDEYVICNNGRITDDEFGRIVSRCKGKVFAIVDTCHSGSMFDLKRTYNGVGHIKKFNKIVIGACRDNELASCDIGEYLGYGGALTLRMIERGYIGYLMSGQIDMFYNKLKSYLSHYGHCPVIQFTQ